MASRSSIPVIASVGWDRSTPLLTCAWRLNPLGVQRRDVGRGDLRTAASISPSAAGGGPGVAGPLSFSVG